MRRFQFRFARILELKGSVEESRRASLGEAVTAAEGVRRELEGLQRERHRVSRAAPVEPAPSVDVEALRLAAHFGQRLEGEIATHQEDLRQAQTVVGERRDELIESTRERRVYEILKERAEAAHRKEQRRQERIWLDEVGQQLHLRRGTEQVEAGDS